MCKPLVCGEIVRDGERSTATEHKRDRKGQEEHRQEHLAGAARRGQPGHQRPSAAMPTSASTAAAISTGIDGPGPGCRKNSQNAGTATTWTASRNRHASIDRAAHMSARSTGAAEQAVPDAVPRAPARTCAGSPSMAVNTDRDPQHAGRRAGAAGQPACRPGRNGTSTNAASTNTTIASTTSRPRSSSTRSLRTSARERPAVHAATLPPASRTSAACQPLEPLRLVGGDTTVRPRWLREHARSSTACPSAVEPGGGLVQQEQRRVVQDGACDRQPLASMPARELGRPIVAALRPTRPTRAHRRSRSAADVVEGGVQLQILARRQPRIDERIVGDVADQGRARHRLAAADARPLTPRPRSAAALSPAPAEAWSCPRRSAPVTTTISPGGAPPDRLPPARARSPKRRTRPSQRDAAGSDDGIGQHPGQEHDRDHAVHGQERHVDATQVVARSRSRSRRREAPRPPPLPGSRGARAPALRPSHTSSTTEIRCAARVIRSARPDRRTAAGSSAAPERGRSRDPWSRR